MFLCSFGLVFVVNTLESRGLALFFAEGVGDEVVGEGDEHHRGGDGQDGEHFAKGQSDDVEHLAADVDDQELSGDDDAEGREEDETVTGVVEGAVAAVERAGVEKIPELQEDEEGEEYRQVGRRQIVASDGEYRAEIVAEVKLCERFDAVDAQILQQTVNHYSEEQSDADDACVHRA